MTNGGGIDRTRKTPNVAGQAGGAQDTEMSSTPKLKLKQNKTPAEPAASAPTVRLKTLRDPPDLNEPNGRRELDDEDGDISLPSDEYRNEQKAGPFAGNIRWKRPKNARDELKVTWRQWERVANTLQRLAQRPGLPDAQRASIERDQNLVETLVRTLQRKELADDSAEAQKARSFMKVVLNLRYGQRHMTLAFRPKQAEVNVYAEKRTDAIRFIRASRPPLSVAEKALADIDDLYTDISNEPSRAHKLDAAQREQLRRDLQTLRSLIEAGKVNDWLPEADQETPDADSQNDMEDKTSTKLNYMERKISELAASISSHVQKILAPNRSIEDDAARDRLDRERQRQVSAAKAFLSAASALEIPPGTEPRFVEPRKQVADALIKAHPVRGREIMDSLPPGYVTGLLAQGAYVEDLARNLMDRADMLHVSQSGFGEGAGRFAFLKGLWKSIRFSNGRALSSWQAAQVRRSVAMLALAGAPRSEIRKVRDSLVSGMRAANGRVGTEGKRNVEGSVTIFKWDEQSFYSLSSYGRQIERTVDGRDSAEQQKWEPLMNLHTAMDNLSAVLEAGCSADDALKVFDHDMKVLGAESPDHDDLKVSDDGMGFGDIVPAQSGVSAISLQPANGDAQADGRLPAISQPEHPYAHLLTPTVENSDED